MKERTGPGIACALAASALYGLIPNFSRAAFQAGIPSYETTFLRTAVIAVALAVLALMRGERLSLPRAGWPAFAAQAAATAIISICYLAAGQFIPVGLAAIIFFTFPVIILLSAPFAEGHRPGWPQYAIALVAFTGLAIAMAANVSTIDGRGVVFALAAAIFCAVQFFSGRILSRHATPVVFGSLVHLVILPVTLAVAVLMNGGTMHMFSGEGVLAGGLGFVFATGAVYVFAYALHMTSLSLARASIVAPFYNLEPIVTTFVAASLLGERLAAAQYLGGGLVLAALVAASAIDLRSRPAVTA